MVFLTVGNEFMIPIDVRRPFVAGEAGGLFPVLAASRADTAGVEGVPQTSALWVAHPQVGWTWNPVAFGAEYFYFGHEVVEKPYTVRELF